MVLSMFPYYGGKAKMAPLICRSLDYRNTTVYVEPFGGACRTLLNKPRHEVEIYNDYDTMLYMFVDLMSKERTASKLIESIFKTVYSEEQFNLALSQLKAIEIHFDSSQISEQDRILLSTSKYVVQAQSRNAMGKTFSRQMFKDKYEAVDPKVKELNMYTDAKYYGDLALAAKYKIKDKETGVVSNKDRWEAYTLEYMTKNPDTGMQEELYKALVVAHQLGFLDAVNNESRWDEPISKTEALQLIMSAGFAANTAYGYASDVEYGAMNDDKFSNSTEGGIEITDIDTSVINDAETEVLTPEEAEAEKKKEDEAAKEKLKEGYKDLDKVVEEAKASGKYIDVFKDDDGVIVVGINEDGVAETVWRNPIEPSTWTDPSKVNGTSLTQEQWDEIDRKLKEQGIETGNIPSQYEGMTPEEIKAQQDKERVSGGTGVNLS